MVQILFEAENIQSAPAHTEKIQTPPVQSQRRASVRIIDLRT